MDLNTLLDLHRRLPTIPKVTSQLIRSFSDEDVSIEEIASQLSADPILSAKLLRLANSAYFQLSRTIATVDDALRMLGFVMVRNMVLGQGMVDVFRNTKGIDLPQFWRYNLYAACAARWLAERADSAPDLVFSVGLLHGIGQLHLHTVAPDLVAPLNRQVHVLAAGRAQLERQELGFHHGEVASGLAKKWNFPSAIVDALRDVPDPMAAPVFPVPAAWVHLGAWRARAEVLGTSDEASALEYPDQVGRHLGRAADWASGLAAEASAGEVERIAPLKELTGGLADIIS